MPRLFTTASSQGLEKTTAVVSAYPITMACWVNPTTIGSTMTAMSMGRSTAANHFWALAVLSTGKAFFESQAGGSAFDAIGTITLVAGRWYHITAVGTSATSRSIYTNGGDKVTETTSNIPASLDRTNIGCLTSSTRTSFFGGIIAHAGVWNVVLDDSEITLLASGVMPPHIRPNSLQSYTPITGAVSPEPDFQSGTGYTLVATPTASTNLPPVSIYPNNFQSAFNSGPNPGVMSFTEKIR